MKTVFRCHYYQSDPRQRRKLEIFAAYVKPFGSIQFENCKKISNVLIANLEKRIKLYHILFPLIVTSIHFSKTNNILYHFLVGCS